MGWQGVSIGKINSVILRFFNKHQGDFIACQSNQEMLELASYIINVISFHIFRATRNIGCYLDSDKTVTSVFYAKNEKI